MERIGVVVTRARLLAGGNTVSMRRLTVLFVLSVVPGCAHYQMWVQPVTVHHDGRVSGTNMETGHFDSGMTLKAGQKVKLLLQPSSRLCVPESTKPVCTLEGRLLRLESSADREVTGLIVKTTSLFVEDFLWGPGKRPPRKNLQVPAGEVRLAIGDIKALFYKYYYVLGT